MGGLAVAYTGGDARGGLGGGFGGAADLIPVYEVGTGSEGGGGGGAPEPDPQNPPSPTPQVSADCLKALNAAGQDPTAIDRAYASHELLNSVGNAYSIPPKLVAAVGVRESGFQSIRQFGGGQGRGVFQIDLGQHPTVKAQEAMDVASAANYAAGLLAVNIQGYITRGYSGEVSIAAGLHAYNSGPPSRSALRRASGGDISALNAGTTNNYVTNVLAIWTHCFPD